MNIACIGAGYVGSVTGAALAVLGYKTTIIDIDAEKINLITTGKSPIFEPGLNELINVYYDKTLFASTSFDEVFNADVVFLCVGTPQNSDGSADLKYIEMASETIAKHLNPNKFTVIINKSTVPLGTTDLVTSIVEKITGLKSELNFSVVSNPEFLREGYALEDVFYPDRIVVGVDSEKAKNLMRDLYSKILNRENYEFVLKNINYGKFSDPKPVYFETDIKSSELIKYASNAFLAVKISYINEIARLCDSLGANVLDVSQGIGLDSRIGEKFLQVSSGWSGSCFPKDTSELLSTSENYGSPLTIVKAAIESNEKMHLYCVEKIQRRLKTLNGKIISVLGLTFKPNTDDARKTQATTIIKKLISLGATVKVHDPKGMDMFKSLNPDISVEYFNNPEDLCRNSDAVILLTHWDEYLNLDWKYICNIMRTPYILDTRNFLLGQKLGEIGYDYEGFGIGTTDKLEAKLYKV
ncbi:UDP-glucose dehydrogenase family protein [Paenibacillus sp. LjRoot56]|uniref:UDP-glucose dehydrogenase family protein n=1 Tax=Paenibacillus sp. LjRoot56 TaxID=3342333 RepID=UPI003ECC76D4